MAPEDALFAAVFNAVDAGVVVLDPQQRVVAWNDWLTASSGTGKADAIGKTLEEIFPDAPLRWLTAGIAGAIGAGTSALVTHALHPRIFPLTTRAGMPLMHNVMVSAIGEKAPFHCIIQLTDVTLATERERVLRKRQNARYDAVVDSAPDVILTIDAEGIIQLANPAAARQFGYTAGELAGTAAKALFVSAREWDDAVRATVEGKDRPGPFHLVARRNDGSPTHVEVSLSKWLSQSQIFITAILRDVSERHRADEALRASEAQFRGLAQAVPHHVWMAPHDGVPDWFNDQAYSYSGLKHGEFDWQSIVHPDQAEEAASLWAKARESGNPYEIEFRLRRADGEYRWHIARAVPIIGPYGHVIRWIGTNTDIEDQKAASQVLADLNNALEQRVAERTEQLARTEDALRQSQKMEAVGQLTGGIAHDFNNLLQGIMGALDRIQIRIADGRIADVDKFVKAALASVNRAAALTHRLLAFSRRQPVDPRPVDARALISTVEELLRKSVGESIELAVTSQPGLWLVRCDENQLENALLNLAINARDAMPDGGTLRIACENHRLNRHEAAARDVDPGEYVRLFVSDTGVGMPPEVKERAFDPFYTTKPIGQGTGLGLSMIYGFVRQSGGSVSIDSAVGRGTTIEICLPRFRGELDAAKADPEPLASIRTNNSEVVLVVEDEAVVRMLVVDLLTDLGYRVLEAADGSAGLRILQSSQRIDLLITDIGLPGLNGRQVADGARVTRPNLKILFMTGYAETAAGQSFLDPGMEIITKPFTTDALTKRLQSMMAK